MRHQHDNNRNLEPRRSARRPERYQEPVLDDDRYDREDELSEGRDFYGYDFGDYRDYEGSELDADDYADRGPDWDDEQPWQREQHRGGRGYAGSDIRGYEGPAYPNYGGGYEGYYAEDERRSPSDYETWRWSYRQSWEPVGEWSSRHSHEFERPGFGRRRSREPDPGPYATSRRQRRRRLEGPGVGELHGGAPLEQPREQGFRGVAPKGYSRSDTAIYEDVCGLLEDADVDPSDVTVSVEDREVVLSGSVDDRWSKRYIEDLAYSVRGVSDVVNKLRIEPREAEGGAAVLTPESRAREDVPEFAG